MREILFRGKRKDTGEWVEGYFIADALEKTHGTLVDWAWIRVPHDNSERAKMHEVIKDTVGQFTGLYDKNGKRVFEGDIIMSGSYVFVVDYGSSVPKPVQMYCDLMGIRHHSVYGLYAYDRDGSYLLEDNRSFEIIGNIHDNPELLKPELLKEA